MNKPERLSDIYADTQDPAERAALIIERLNTPPKGGRLLSALTVEDMTEIIKESYARPSTHLRPLAVGDVVEMPYCGINTKYLLSDQGKVVLVNISGAGAWNSTGTPVGDKHAITRAEAEYIFGHKELSEVTRLPKGSTTI